jgi:hypothetical protein
LKKPKVVKVVKPKVVNVVKLKLENPRENYPTELRKEERKKQAQPHRKIGWRIHADPISAKKKGISVFE